jgi:hypothetical protein
MSPARAGADVADSAAISGNADNQRRRKDEIIALAPASIARLGYPYDQYRLIAITGNLPRRFQPLNLP